jgi:hypothetical protein
MLFETYCRNSDIAVRNLLPQQRYSHLHLRIVTSGAPICRAGVGRYSIVRFRRATSVAKIEHPMAKIVLLIVVPSRRPGPRGRCRPLPSDRRADPRGRGLRQDYQAA